MTYTREQLVEVASAILNGGMDVIENRLPPNVDRSVLTLRTRKIIDDLAGSIQYTVCMQLAILYSNITNDGIAPGDLEAWQMFGDLVNMMIKERLNPEYQGYKKGERCSPDCTFIAENFADFCLSYEDNSIISNIFNNGEFEKTAQEYIDTLDDIAPSKEDLVKCVGEGVKAWRNGERLSDNPYLKANVGKMWKDSMIKAWEVGYFRNMPAVHEGGYKI